MAYVVHRYVTLRQQVHTGFEGTIIVTDKICETCYRPQLTLLKTEETSGCDNEEFESLVSTLQNSDHKLRRQNCYRELLANHALILHSAYSTFMHQVQTLVTMSSYTKLQR